MTSHRLTLISDPTDEFAQNTNSAFTLRLQRPLRLADGSWEACLLSVSCPSASRHDWKLVGIDPETVILKNIMYYQRMDESHTINGVLSIRLKEIMTEDHPVVSGRQFWQRLIALATRKINEICVNFNVGHNGKRFSIFDSRWNPYLEWIKGDEVILPRRWYANALLFHESIVKLFGVLSQDGRSMGPNVSYNLPRDPTHDPPRQNAPTKGEFLTNDVPTWKLVDGYMHLNEEFEWHIYNVDASFEHKKTSHSLFVYTDLVESSFVGNQQHQLLREIFLDDSVHGRRLVEPLRLQWMPVRTHNIETVEVQIATQSGALATFDAGKTIVTVLLRKKTA